MARVLVVDDAAFMRKMVTDALSGGGHEIVGEAANGAEAVQRLQELRPAHHPVLPLRKRPDRPIHLTRSRFAAHIAAKLDGVGFRPGAPRRPPARPG